uniref:Uncharacterized protein n=1 Tax=Xenopus tropicalis TaxID=8364 RepID=A0A1B8Y193_XENTR
MVQLITLDLFSIKIISIVSTFLLQNVSFCFVFSVKRLYLHDNSRRATETGRKLSPMEIGNNHHLGDQKRRLWW